MQSNRVPCQRLGTGDVLGMGAIRAHPSSELALGSVVAGTRSDHRDYRTNGPGIRVVQNAASHMKSRTLHIICGALALLAACASPRPATAPSRMGPEAAKARARADSLRYPYTKADIDFMSGMVHHHAQAILIARWAPTHGASPAVIRLTERIINAQNDEIVLMQNWLRDRNQPAPEPNAAGMPMMHGDMQMVMRMPGMLTDAQLAQLDAARGDGFDHLFLTFMIQHHRGAVDMVHTLFSSNGAGQDESIFKFAADVEVDQSTEIKRMLQMLIENPTPPTQRNPE